MTWADERKNHNGESKKSRLLPRGDEAKEIIEVLAEMYRDIQNPEDVRNDDRSEQANRKRVTRRGEERIEEAEQ